MELNIGANIKRLRLAKGFTQEQLANLLSVSTAAVSKWETKNIYPDITALFPLAEIFEVSMDELLGYDQIKVKADIDKLISEYQTLKVNGHFAEASKLIASARKKYPNDYRIMNAYMWDKAGGKAGDHTETLLKNQKEFTQICNCILAGCTQENLRIEAINMKAKLLHTGGDTEGALEILSQLPDLQAPMLKEALFGKDTSEFRYWNKRNCYGLMNVTAIKHARIVWFDPLLSIAEKIERIELIAETFSETGQKKDFEFFCIGEQAIYSLLADMLTVGGASVEDVIRIREKEFAAMEKMMRLAESDEILYECIEKTYKTNDMIAWRLKRLLSSPHTQFAKYRENPEYMEMLSGWKR